MRSAWASELKSFGVRVVGCTVVGAVAGSAVIGLAVGATLYALRHILHARRLNAWLDGSRRGYPPDGDGIWHVVFTQMNRLARSERQRHERLSRVLRRFRRSARAIPDALVLVDADGEIQWGNVAARRLLGIDGRRDRGHRIENLLRHPLFVQFFTRKVEHESLLLPSPTLAEVQLDLRLVDFDEGFSLLIARDNTERQRVERMRRDFVANVSHELRTPLTVLSGYLENMAAEPDSLPERWRKPTQTMDQQVKRMRALIEDLLLLARVEVSSAVEHTEVVNMAALLRQVRADALQVSGSGAGRIDLDVDSALGVSGVEAELRTVCTNLVMNAVQYTPPERAIEVSWFDSSAGPVLEVRDHGDGIDPEHLPRLTERFYRVDAGRSREKGGTGLGLSIVRHVLERHGASLNIASTWGEGTTFTCRFPPDTAVHLEPTLRVVGKH